MDTSQNAWTGRIDPTRLDRSPQLYPGEQAEIALLMEQWTRRVFYARQDFVRLPKEYALHRLLAPIYQVGKLTKVSYKTQAATTRLLVREMYQRKTSYWAWSETEWCDILQPSVEAFRARYHCYHHTRALLLLVSYMLCDFHNIYHLNRSSQVVLAKRIFGEQPVKASIQQVGDELVKWGYTSERVASKIPKALCLVMLVNHSPRLEDITIELLEDIRRKPIAVEVIQHMYRISLALYQLGYITTDLRRDNKQIAHQRYVCCHEGVPAPWLDWCDRWEANSTRTERYRVQTRRLLLKIGRYLAVHHPDMTCPLDWTRETALAVVAAVTRMKVGQWNSPSYRYPANVVKKMGCLLSASSRDKVFAALRCFFRDGQEWGWFPCRWNPSQVLITPFSAVVHRKPAPRTIASDVWAKLLYAGLNLSLEDLPASGSSTPQKREVHYPLEMVQAISIVWLFSGLRCDEIRRLRVGCIRWQEEEVSPPDAEPTLAERAICWLDVPVNKTSSAFTKPVDRLVGEAITRWEQQRPGQPVWHDRKTGELVCLLFSWRGKIIGQEYINHSLIPMLCQKAGVPQQDALGSITSHRARSTIASQLFNAKEPLSLFDLQQWLGHRFITSTQHYAQLSPAKVSKSYQKAGYFERNIRTIEVLLDQQAIRDGAAVRGEPWKYYDLGHGYCTYDFFDQCPHRMACAKCSFYRPKASTKALWREGKVHLEQMLQKIPLQEEERDAVEEGIEAMKKLLGQLADVPTPDGRTPNQLNYSQTSNHHQHEKE